MMIDDASYYLFCHTSKPKQKNKQKSFKQKSFDDFTVARSRGQQFTSQLCVFVNVMWPDLDQSHAGILHSGITVALMTWILNKGSWCGW